MMDKTLEDELNNVRARIKAIDEESEILKKRIINDIFDEYLPELMSYEPYKRYVELSITFLRLRRKEDNLVDGIDTSV